MEDLRRGWYTHIGFGLDNSAHYLLMYGQPTPGSRRRITEQAWSGFACWSNASPSRACSVSVETAVSMVHAACVGLKLNLIGTPPEERDRPSDRLREAMIASITTAAPTSYPPSAAQRAVALKAVLGEVPDLYSPGERASLNELLDRAADHTPAR